MITDGWAIYRITVGIGTLLIGVAAIKMLSYLKDIKIYLYVMCSDLHKITNIEANRDE